MLSSALLVKDEWDGEDMRKTVLLLATMFSAVLIASGVAWATHNTTLNQVECKASKSCQGTGGADEITGTTSRDVIIPYDGDDLIYASGGNDDVRHSFGNDDIYGGEGNDTLRGGRGEDAIYGGNGADLIDCAYLETRKSDQQGDIAYADGLDTVVDCARIEPDPTSTEKPRET